MSDRSTQTLTVHVPVKFAVRGGRKAITAGILPPTAPPQRTEQALLKALAKAFRWRKQIEAGGYASITELAHDHRVNESYACRLLRLSLLSPEIVLEILDGRSRPVPTLQRLIRPLPLEWAKQRAKLDCK